METKISNYPFYACLSTYSPHYHYSYVFAYVVVKSGLNSINLNYRSQTCSTITESLQFFLPFFESFRPADPTRLLHDFYISMKFFTSEYLSRLVHIRRHRDCFAAQGRYKLTTY